MIASYEIHVLYVSTHNFNLLCSSHYAVWLLTLPAISYTCPFGEIHLCPTLLNYFYENEIERLSSYKQHFWTLCKGHTL